MTCRASTKVGVTCTKKSEPNPKNCLIPFYHYECLWKVTTKPTVYDCPLKVENPGGHLPYVKKLY